MPARRMTAAGLCLALQACAFPAAVQRIGVEYNAAVSGMANELTLLNIVRAKEDLPLHYTSVSRLSGSFTMRGSAGVNDAIRGGLTTTTNQVAATAGAAPGTVTTVVEQLQNGVDVVTPSLGGEINTGPSFDIAILDTQRFYQGILAAVPFSTVENYISQGYSDQLIMRLMVERIDFLDAEEGPHAGRLVFSWTNAATGDAAMAFDRNIRCYALVGRNHRRTAVDIVPLSRLQRGAAGGAATFTVDDIRALSGDTLELSGPIGASADGDAGVTVRRVFPERRVADLRVREDCIEELGLGIRPLERPPSHPVYLGNYTAMVLDPDHRSNREVAVEPQIVFRSAESIIRFLGRYLNGLEDDPRRTPLLDGLPLFSLVRGQGSGAIVSARVLGQRYSIVNDANRRRNMLVLALVQQLVNLHKESSERPETIPVRVIGGS